MKLSVDQALMKGIAAHNEGKTSEAARFYRGILRVQPSHSDANHNLGVLVFAQRDVGNALSLFENALEANPNIEKYWVTYIEALVQEKEYELALSVLKNGKSEGVSAETFDALKMLIDSSSKSKKFGDLRDRKKNLSIINRGRVSSGKKKKYKSKKKSQRDSGPWQEEIQVLVELFATKKFEETERLARACIKKRPYDPFPWKILGAVFGETGQIEDALKVNSQAVKLAPSDAEGHYNLGLTLKMLGRLAEAEISLRKAIELNPLFPEAFYNLGSALRALKRDKEAKTAYCRAIELKPSFFEAHFDLGNTLREMERLEEAEKSYLRAIGLKEDFADAHYNFGATAQKLGKLKEARQGYAQAISIRANYPEAHNNLGTILKEYGRFEDAKASYTKALELKPDFPEARYNLGVLLISLGDYQEAKKFLLDNCNGNSQTLLLKCYFELEDKVGFVNQLDFLMQRGEINSTIGSLTARAEIRYGIKKNNVFAKTPFHYVVKKGLSENCDFEETFVRPIKDVLKEENLAFRKQDLLTKGHQTAGNLFAKNNEKINRIERIILQEIEKYHVSFHNSDEGFLKKWPSEFYLKGWLINMKSGGELGPHMHEHGWLSGAVYINVPEKKETSAGNFVVCVDEALNRENRKFNADQTIDVSTGDVVIFPASLMHYTIPFASSEDRTVLAFDVRPA